MTIHFACDYQRLCSVDSDSPGFVLKLLVTFAEFLMLAIPAVVGYRALRKKTER